MQLSDVYALDPQQGFWRRADAHAFAYSDGDAVEQRIRDIVRDCADVSVLSEALSRAIDDWPTLYHLGKGRANLLRPFGPLLQGRILEIGCGCGAITRALGESGGQVLALEGSAVRAGIAASRCRDLTNVTVVCDSFDQFEALEPFDVVTLIGVLEYARKYFNADPGQDPVVATIERAKSFLRPGGTLVIAIENQLGLKYFAGSPEDHHGIPMYGIEDLYQPHDAVTFGKLELSKLLQRGGLVAQQWWYPFPDYKFPISILSEHGVGDAKADLSPLLQNSALLDPQPAPTSFSLESAWLPVFRNGLAGALANSFLVLASSEVRATPADRVLAYHYASNRRSSFAKQVAFVRNEDGSVAVRHTPLYSASETNSSGELAIEFEEAEFIAGRHWQKELVRIVNRPGWTIDDVESWASVWFKAFLQQAAMEPDVVFDKNTLVAGDHFDAVPRNLIVRPDGVGVFFDQEWRMAESIPLGLVIFRGLGLSFFGVTSVAAPHEGVPLDVKQLLLTLGHRMGVALDVDDVQAYVASENRIQHSVAPEASSQLTMDALSSWTLNVRMALWNPQRLYQLEADVSRRDEQLGALGAEVHRLEQYVRDKDAALQKLGATLHSVHEALAEKDGALAEQSQAIHRLEAAIQLKESDVHALSSETERLHAVIAEKDAALTSQAQDIHRLEDFAKEKEAVLKAFAEQLTAGTEDIAARRKAFELEERSRLQILRNEMASAALIERVAHEKQRLLNEFANQLVTATEEIEARRRIIDQEERLSSHAAEDAIATAALFRAVEQDKQKLLKEFSDQLSAATEEIAARRQDYDRQAQSGMQLIEESMAKSVLEVQAAQNQARIDELSDAAQEWERERQYFYAEVDKRDKLLATDAAKLAQLKAELVANTHQLQALKLTRWFRLREVLVFHPFGIKKLVHAASIVAGAAVPQRFRSTLVPRLNRALGLAPAAAPQAEVASAAYRIKQGEAPPPDAPKVAHVIANFMTGGSSRLVVDLIEHLGSSYRHVVFTSFNPDPPAYVGLEIEECRSAASVDPFIEYFARVQPDLVHVHYWGDCDEPWYAQAIAAAGQLGVPIIENINTPIEPYRSAAVARYVYVSDYVRSVFGDDDARHVTVYPGSDFELFTRSQQEHAPEDCVGMVYRLERDKLNESAIQPFIEIANLRPATRILIVGGGSLLEPFQEAVRVAGVADRFEFAGYVSYDSLPSYYRRMSVFIAPVWKESFGQVSPFAMSMKVPVIGYDIGAIGEIVGEPQLLAPAADAQALAQIAISLLDSPERRRRVGEDQQRRAVGRFSLEAMIADYARLYAEVASIGRQGVM